METAITRRLSAKNMVRLFDQYGKVNIRHFHAKNPDGGDDLDRMYTYEITVRHNEEEDAGRVFDLARSEMIKATAKALDFLCVRKPSDFDCSQSAWVSILLDFQIMKGDDALEALAGSYVYCIDHFQGDEQNKFIMQIFSHDLNERGDVHSLPRSSSYQEFWLAECEKP